MRYTFLWAVTTALVTGSTLFAADAKHSLKPASGEAPKELSDEIRKLMGDKSVQLLDDKNEVILEVWLRKEVPVKATAAQVQNGLTYREVPESTILGAIRFPKEWTDYRKQKIPAGVYTLRLAYQPMDGDHMGTAPYAEFCLLAPAKHDQKPALLEGKPLYELSMRSTMKGTHPGVMLLFPPEKKTPDSPALVDKGEGNFALSFKEDAKAESGKAILNFNLIVVGHTTSE